MLTPSRVALTLVCAVALLAPALPSQADSPVPSPVTVRAGARGARLGPTAQGFSVESADFAHGYLSAKLLAKRLDTLGPHGVLRIGGYSMDLVWPAFGGYKRAPVPPEAIGGRVDLADLRKLDRLTRESGWKVSIGLPFKAIIDQPQVKDPTKDPAPPVTLDQAMAEVKAVHKVLGDRLVGVEVGNEYDNITTLSAADMWAWTQRYRAAVARAVPGAGLKVIAPSNNTATTNTRLHDFVTAATQAPSVAGRVLEEVSSHYYPTSHCGSSNATIDQLLSAKTYATTQAKLDGITAEGQRLGAAGASGVPMTLNESNTASCSGQPGVSNAYAVALWALDYQLQVARAGIARVQFHTSTRAVCGDFKPRTSPEYPISYRYYGAFCAPNSSALAKGRLAPMPLYYGLWAFRQVGTGRFTPVDIGDAAADPTLHAYAVRSGRGEHRTLRVVLVDLADRATTGARTVRVGLPAGYRSGRALTLQSSDPAGLGSLDVGQISLGGRHVRGDGSTSGRLRTARVPVRGHAATIVLAPGSAQIVTFRH